MKNTKRILSLVMTVLMIIGSASMIFAYADTAEHTCVDTEPKDLYCDICKKGIKTTIDFSKASYSVSYDKAKITLAKTAESITISNHTDNTVRGYGFNTGLPVAYNIYDIEFWLEYSGTTPRYTFWPVSAGNSSSTSGNGKLGWSYSKDGTQLCRVRDCANTTYKTFDRDIGENNRQYLKIRVDGITGNLTLYAKKNGDYTQVDSYSFNVVTFARLIFAIGVYDKLSTTQNFTIGGASYTKVCSDENRDHKCDICEQPSGTCADTNKDHVCDYGCSKSFDTHAASSDDNHTCDYCGDLVSVNNGVAVDFTDANNFYTAAESDMGGATVTQKVGEIGFSNKTGAATLAGVNLKNYTVKGNVYDVYYSLYVSDITTNRIGFQVVSTKSGTNGAIRRSGWVLAKEKLGQLTKLDNGSTGTSLYLSSFDFDDADGFEVPLKMRVDGVNDVLTLYVRKNGYYVAVDSYTVGISSSYLYASAYAWDAIAEDDYAAVKNVKVERVCYDDDKDHKCDKGCDLAFGTCADSETDVDHLCDYGCGKVFNECADGETVDHKCDACESALTNLCAEGETVDHKCDVCARVLTNLCSEGEKLDHKCGVCGVTLGALVDFSGEDFGGVSSYEAKAGTNATGGLGSITVSNKSVNDGDMYGKDTGKLIKGHIYEITYTLNKGVATQSRVSMEFVPGSYMRSDNTRRSGILGWCIQPTAAGEIAKASGYAINEKSKGDYDWLAVDRDIDTENDNEQKFKVVINGFDYTLSLYVMKDGAWVEAEDLRIEFTASDDATLTFAFGSYDKITDENYIRMSDVMLCELCSDVNEKDHKCDVCNVAVTDPAGCVDPAKDGDHLCDYCGKKANECVDAENDGNHECEECGEIASVCADKAGDKDHLCDECNKAMENETCYDETNDGDHACDECGDIVSECEDEFRDGDHKCDDCGKILSRCSDVAGDNDHYCDECGELVASSKCFDVEGDNDHLCEECDELVADSKCFDKAGDGDHFCEECGERVSNCADVKPLDGLCDECGIDVNHNCVDVYPVDHACDICGDVLSEHVDVNKNHACDICKDKMGTHRVAKGAHTCDYCGVKMTECADKDANGECDVCGKSMPTKVVEDVKGSVSAAIEAAKAQAEAAAKAAAEAAAKAAQEAAQKLLDAIFAEDSEIMNGLESIGGAISDVIADVKASLETKLEDALNEIKQLFNKVA